MFWILYRSQPTVPPWPASILDIARSCERNNPATGVSGVLFYSNDTYLQYLEGDEAAITALWAKISQDDRHRIAWQISGEGASKLENLNMGYFDYVREKSRHKDTDLWIEESDWQPEAANNLRAMLIAVAQEKYPASLSDDKN